MKANSVLETVGNTPHIRINRLFGDKAEVWVKSERSNPGASIKDRIALSMVEDAERSGKLLEAARPATWSKGTNGLQSTTAAPCSSIPRRPARPVSCVYWPGDNVS